jgi:MFS family permease
MAAPPFLRVIREPNYRLFAVGFLASSTGLQMMTTAVLWEIWLVTHDALSLGLAGLARAIPVIALALLAGHAADRHSRRAILVITQCGFVAIAIAFAVASSRGASEWTWYALLFASGCVRSFNGPSRNSLLPLLVKRENFESAVTCNSGIFQASAVAGPIAAGALLGAGVRGWVVMLVSAGLILVLAVVATLLRPRVESRAHSALTIGSMLAGMGHIWKERVILATLTLDLFGVLLGGATALLPIYADEILGGGPTLLGWLKAAPYLGAFAMAVWLAARPRLSHAGRALLLSVAVFGLSMVVFGISTWTWLSLLMLFASGAADNVSVIIRHTLVQARTPNHLRGRVSAINSVFIECSNELGAFESGLVARLAGPVLSVVTGGLGTIAVVGAVAWAFPEVKRLRHLVSEEPQPVTS